MSSLLRKSTFCQICFVVLACLVDTGGTFLVITLAGDNRADVQRRVYNLLTKIMLLLEQARLSHQPLFSPLSNWKANTLNQRAFANSRRHICLLHVYCTHSNGFAGRVGPTPAW